MKAIRRLIDLGMTVSLALLIGLIVGMSAQAEGGLALSGNFYRQQFNVPQGATLSSPGVYVVVFNNSDAAFTVRVLTTTPQGVHLALSEKEFELKAGAQKKIEVGVEVGPEAIPGDYKVSVIAEAQKEATGGIQLLGAAAQEAELTVTGNVATVQISCVSPSGDPVPAVVRLSRKSDEQDFEVGYSESGSLETKVSPGDYVVSAHVGGKKLLEKSFSVEADDAKKVQLTLKTVYIEGFGAVPSYNTTTGELGFAHIVYTINNLYQAFPEANAVLRVERDGELLDEMTVASLAPLEKGKMGSSYSYVPSEGWSVATYSFKLVLFVEGEAYTASPVAELVAGEDMVPGAGLSMNWTMIGAVGGLVLLVAVVILVALRRRARD